MTHLQDTETVSAYDDIMLDGPDHHPRAGNGNWKLLLGLSLGATIAFLGPRLLPNRSESTTPPQPTETTSVSVQTVTVTPVQMTPVSDRLTVSGTVQAADLLEVNPQLGGLPIQQVLVEVGDRVAAGQALLVLDDTELRTQIQRAESEVAIAIAQVQQQQANLAQARALQAEAAAKASRFESLSAQGAISQEELETRLTQARTAQESVRVAQANLASAEATVQARQAELERLQTQLSRTTVVAPAEGIVSERPASVGQVSATGDAVVRLIQGNQLELAAQVPQSQLPQVQVGAPVRVTSSTDGQWQVSGTVQEIKPLVDAQSRAATVIIRLPVNDRLRSGMFLTAEIQTGTRSGLTVPVQAVLPQPDGSMRVLVLGEGNRAIARSVTPGVRLLGATDQPDRVEIREGLAAGEQVIVAGAGFVQDGDTVTVSP